MNDFWAIPDHRSVTCAHLYRNGQALCGSPMEPGKNRWTEQPGKVACKKCRRAILFKTGHWCPSCCGKGRQTIQRVPTRKTRTCQRCDGLGLIPCPDQILFVPDPPPPPNIRPPFP